MYARIKNPYEKNKKEPEEGQRKLSYLKKHYDEINNSHAISTGLLNNKAIYLYA